MVSHTDAGEPPLTTRLRYDELNREVWRKAQCSEPDCGEITTAYPVASEVTGAGVKYSVRVRGPGPEPGSQVTTRSGYDGRGLLVATLDAYSNRHEWGYDALGRLKRTMDEEGIVVTQAYDARGFLSEKRIRGRSETNPGLLTEYVADAAGNMLFTRRHRGGGKPELVTGATYDDWNRAITLTAPGSNAEELAYDGEGNVVRHKDAGGRIRDWQRDQRGNVVRFFDAEVKARTAGQASTPADADFAIHYDEIDANDNPQKVVNALGVVTRYTYDAEERVTAITEAEGSAEARTREFRQIDGLGNPHVVTDWRGNATELTFSARHNVLTKKDPLGRTTAYSYDGQANPASVKTPRDLVRTFKRDALGRVTDVLYPGTTVESHSEYDKVGSLRKSRNRRGTVTHYELDQYLRVEIINKSLGETGPLTRIQTNEYDDVGNVTAVTDGNGNRTVYEFNSRNLLWKTILPAVASESESQRTEVREYTASGALLSVTAPGDNGDPDLVTTYAHDKEDRTISITAAGETTTSAYDLIGNLRSQTMPEGQTGGKFAGKTKRFDYDDLRRVTRLTDEVGLTTKYLYDKADNLRDVEGPFGDAGPNVDTPHVGYVYNAKVDRLEEHLQYRKVGGALVTRYDGFDAPDNVTHLVDANGSAFTYQYDAYDRRTQAQYPSKPTALNEPKQIAWDFDDQENTVTITETKKGPSGAEIQDVTLERYDLLFDRLESRTQRGQGVSYAYDTNGNRTRVTSPQGTTNYTFDARNRVQTAMVGSATSTYQYHADGRVRSITRPNGATTSLTYYPTRRVHQITHEFAGGEAAQVAYTYDKNGNRTSAGDTRNGSPDVTTFDEYDAANRLVQFSQDGRVTRYGYQRYNRQSENVKENGVTRSNKTLGYDELERLNTVVDDAQAPVTVTYGYEDNGNTLSRTVSNAPADRVDFQYDSRDQLVRVTRGPPGSEQLLGRYDYDSEGKRTRHLDSERGSVEYVYDDQAVIEERLTANPNGDPPNARVTRYHYGQDLLAIAEDAGTRYYHQDALGSTTQLSDSAGLTTVEYKTDPFGNVRLSDGDTDNRQTFTGQEYDERTGLYYYGARYYDPVIGRFINQDSYLGDPGTPASLHRYLYAYSNPLSYTDPTGHIAFFKDATKTLDEVDQFMSEDSKRTTGTGDLALNIGSRAAMQLIGGAVSAVNVAANLVAASGAMGTSLGAEARSELHESYEGAKKAVTTITNLHHEGKLGEAAGAVLAQGAAKVGAALSGDRQAISDLASKSLTFVGEMALTGGMAGFKGGAQAAAQGAKQLAAGGKALVTVAKDAGVGIVKTAARITMESGGGRLAAREALAVVKTAASKAAVRVADSVSAAARGTREMGFAKVARSFANGYTRTAGEIRGVTAMSFPGGVTLTKIAGGIGEVATDAAKLGRKAGAAAAEGAGAITPHRIVSVGTSNPSSHGVSFFGDDVAQFYKSGNSTLGRAGGEHFFMPLEDAGGIGTAADASRYSGAAPSVTKAYMSGGDVYGVSFPLQGRAIRAPTAADAGSFPHFMEGGRTAVRGAGPNGGMLTNSTREFVTPGGGPVPAGSVLFKLGPNGEWITVRRF